MVDKDHQKLTNHSDTLGLERIKEGFLFGEEGLHERGECEVRNGFNPREVEEERMAKGIFGDIAASGEAEFAVAGSGSGEGKARRREGGEVGFGAIEETESVVSFDDGVEEREIAKGGVALDGSYTRTGELLAELLAALATEKRKDRFGGGESGGGSGGREGGGMARSWRKGGGGVKEGSAA